MDRSIPRRAWDALKQVSIEPYMFFCMFAYDTSLVTLQSLLMHKACKLLLKHSDETCDNLESDDISAEHAEAVQYGNNLFLGIILMSTIPALIVATFVGPWSDKYSRRYPLIISASGIFVDVSINAALAFLPNASPYLFFVSATASGVTGGFIMAMSSTYSYLSDITDEKSRPTRYAVLEFFTLLSIPLGSLVGGQVFRVGGHRAVMVLAPCSLALALLWAVFRVRETKPPVAGVSGRQMARDLFRLDNVRDSVRTCLQPRPGNLRKQIWLLVLVYCSIKIVEMGTFSAAFAYTKVMYSWSVTQYSDAYTGFTLLTALTTVALIPVLNKRLMLHEAALGLVGVLSLMAKMVLMSVAFRQEYIYYAWFSGALYSGGAIAVRSRLSKLVSKQELGRAFSLLATCESLTPVLGTIIFTQILNSSIKFYPGLPFAISAVLLVPAALVFTWMMRMPTMSFSQFQDLLDGGKGRPTELENVEIPEAIFM